MWPCRLLSPSAVPCRCRRGERNLAEAMQVNSRYGSDLGVLKEEAELVMHELVGCKLELAQVRGPVLGGWRWLLWASWLQHAWCCWACGRVLACSECCCPMVFLVEDVAACCWLLVAGPCCCVLP